MPDLGKYADAVLSAYGVSLLLLALLIVWTLRQGRRARRALQEVEKRSKRDA
ncbi:heme exporter protein CcmD [uncultured Roseobacter sp.]|uniref:heme exporter protein CcmD n=1 Tax=uncultured Roseobacter sp. TaxID=114847 RepID=UPI00263282AD|nr:heme exporter protein CcmD [uncultured Roseobacter sp.]